MRIRAPQRLGLATLLVAGVAVLPGTASAAAPANDSFAGATPIGPAPPAQISGSTLEASRESGEPNHAGNPGGKSVWYSWVAPSTGAVKVETCGSSFDTLLGVYTGSAVGSLNSVVSNDDGCGLGSRVRFNAVAGQDYRIAVDGYGGAAGTVTLSLSAARVPANNDFAAAETLTPDLTHFGSNRDATAEQGEPDHDGSPGGASVWYRWTPAADASGEAQIDLCRQGSFDSVVGVYTGNGLGDLSRVALNDDGPLDYCLGAYSAVQFAYQGGTTYFIAVHGRGAEQGEFGIALHDDPANTEITSPEPGFGTEDTTPTFSFSSSRPLGPGGGYFCRIDGGPYSFCGATGSYTPTSPLARGAHSFSVYAYTRADGTDLTPARIDFTVGIAPETTIDSGPAGITNSAGPSFTFSGTSSPSGFECRLDSQQSSAWQACSSPKTFAGLSEGAHAFEVRAINATGPDATPATRSFTVDTRAPNLSVSSGPSGPTNNASPTFSFDAESGASTQCSIDQGTVGFSSCSGTTTHSPSPSLADGAYTFRVKATDAAGNSATATRSFTVDTQAPDAQIDSGPSGSTNNASASFTFSGSGSPTSHECRLASELSWQACSSPKAYSNLADGSHTFEVRATDAAGNTDQTPATRSFTIDTQAPSVSVSFGPTGPTNNASPTFGFNIENNASSQCSVDQGDSNFGPCSAASSHTPASALSDGFHTFRVKAIDAAGNSAIATRSFTVDTQAPDTQVDSGPTGPTNNASPSFAFSGSGSPVSYECRLANEPSWQNCSSPKAYSNLADGQHTFEVRATDAAGNSDPTPATRSFTVDTQAPETQIDSGPSGPTNNATPSFAFSGSGSPASYECRLASEASWQACSSPKAYANLADGQHTFEVRAIDAAGNTDQTPASRSFTVDTRPPSLSIDSGPSDATNNASPSFGFDAESGAATQCSIDQGAASFAACSAAASHTPSSALSDGDHTFRVKATDAAGNSATATRSFTVDTEAPDTQIDSGPTGATNNASPSLGFSGSGSPVRFECQLNAGWEECSSPETYSNLADGQHTFEVRAIDAAGNTDQTPASRSFTVDTQAPDTQIDSGPTGPTNSASPTFVFDAENGASVECSLDQGTASFGACSSASSHAPPADLSDGDHTFRVKATDAAGNSSTATRSFTVDTQAPDTQIDSGPTGPTNNASPSFAFSGSGSSTTYECRLAGEPSWQSCSSPKAYSNLADGQHTFEVRATDAAANTDPTPASRSFTVDTQAPSLSINAGPSGATNNTSPAFGFGAEDGSATQCSIDQGPGDFGACSSSSSHAPSAVLDDGQYAFRVRATDAAGNTRTESRSFTVDTEPPALTIASGPEGVTNDATPTFEFDAEDGIAAECSIDLGFADYGACSSPDSHTPASDLRDGPYTFRVEATDSAGNTTTRTRDFIVLAVAGGGLESDTQIDSGPSGPTSNDSPAFAFSGTNVPSGYQCRLDSSLESAWQACSSPKGFTDLAEGAHTFEVRAISATGPDPTPASRSFTVDTQAPTISISSGPSGPTDNASPSFGFDAENGASVECSVDQGTASFSSCSAASSHAPPSALTDGSHTFRVKATDTAGNSATATRSFTVDTQAPSLSVSSGPSGPTNNDSPNFSFAAEAGASVECSLDQGTASFGACSSASSHAPPAELSDGNHTFRVKATDAAGNSSTATRSFTVDTEAPSLSINSGPAGPTSNASPTFSFDAENGASAQCSIDQGTVGFSSCSGTTTHSPSPSLADGAYTFRVKATDAAGNISTATRSFTVDTQAPSLSISSGPSGPTNNASPTFGFNIENGASTQCSVDQGDSNFGACSAALSHTPASALTNGSHTFRVRATDPAGNTATATRSFAVDTQAPSLSIASGPSGPTNDAGPSFGFDAEFGASTECSIDQGTASFGTCSDSSRHTPSSPLDDGSHTFRVKATDAAGNTATATQSFTVDTRGPNLLINSGPSGPSNNPSPSFGFDAEDGASVECSFDQGTANYGACSDAVSHTPSASLADGAYTFRVKATDAAGNSTTATRSFTVDTQAPETQINSGPTGATNNASPSFGFSGSGSPDEFECRLDAGWEECSSPEAYASLTNGQHTFEVRAIDAAGNTDPTPASRSFTVDTQAPTISISSGPSGPTDNASPSFGFDAENGASVECSVDQGTASFSSCSAASSHAPPSALTDGSHTFRVKATDTAGNSATATRSFTVDTQAPSLSVSSGPSGPTNNDSPSFSFDAENGTSLECSVDSGSPSFGACSAGAGHSPSTALSDGSHTFRVKATDAAGNSATATRSFTVDTEAPSLSINSGPAGPTNNASPTFSFDAESGASTQCSIDQGTVGFSSCSGTTTHSPSPSLADGAYTFRVKATDAAGNISTATRSFTVDTQAPDTQVDSGPTGPTNNASPSFTFSGSGSPARFECRLDAGWEGCSSPKAYSNLADGQHTFEVRATDAAGNTDQTPATRSFTVDSQAPDTQIESGPSGSTSNASPSFVFSGSGSPASYQCRLASEAWQSCSSPKDYSNLADGQHTFEVRATDSAGNTDQTPASRSFTVDSQAPALSINSGPSGPTNNASPTFGFAAENGASIECSIDQGTANYGACSGSSSHTPSSALSDGSHTFRVHATDAAGNTSTATRNFTVDTQAPDTEIDSGPTGPTDNASPSIAFSGSGSPARFECRLDAGWEECSSARGYSNLTDGPYTFEVRATDAAGNTDQTPATRSFTVDTQAPDTQVDSGPSGPTSHASPNFTFSGSGSPTSYECRLASEPSWQACSSPKAYSNLADGQHTFEVRATDSAGNSDQTPATRSFTVDTQAPDAQIDSGPTGPTNNASPSFSFSSSGSPASYECRLASEPWQSCSSPKGYSNLADGQHTFEVRATDSAGNTDQTPASRSFTVDSQAPALSINSGPSGPTNNASPTFGFAAENGASIECSIDQGTANFGACSSGSSHSPSGALADGSYTFRVRATDAAGNPATVSRSFAVDRQPPETQIDSGPAGPTASASPSFGFSGSGSPSNFECRLDSSSDADWQACSSTKTYAGLSEGQHTFEVRATDAAGNTDQTPATRSFTVDTQAPDTQIDSGPTGPTNSASPSFAFSSSGSPASYECRLANEPSWQSCSSPKAYSNLTDGQHTFEVRATDAAGNTDQTPATRSFTVDTQAPDTQIESGPSGPTNNASPSFAFSGSGSPVRFECRLGAGWEECASPKTYSDLADGSRTFEARAVDAAGNTDNTPASRSFSVDTQAPSLSINSGPSGPTDNASPTFGFAAESGASTGCSIDQGAANYGACSAASSHTPSSALSDGFHTFRVQAADAAGNTSTATRNFTVDTQTPTLSITAGPDGPTNNPRPAFSFDAPAGATLECSIDQGAAGFGPCSTPSSHSPAAALADGDYTFRVRATKASGTSSTATRAFTVDTQAPETQIDSGTSGPTNNASQSFSFSGSGSPARFECRLDAGWEECSSARGYSDLADGPYTFEVRATDAAGNTDQTPATRSFTVDTQAPNLAITSGPSGVTSTATPSFGFDAEAGAATECSIDQGSPSFGACAAPGVHFPAAPLADGAHTFRVRATDAAGNTAVQTRSFIVSAPSRDSTPPETVITDHPPSKTSKGLATFAFGSSESGSRFECRVDGASFRSCTSPHSVRVSDGRHTFRVRAIDAAGNVDPTPASFVWTKK